jgi:hypothetical protein
MSILTATKKPSASTVKRIPCSDGHTAAESVIARIATAGRATPSRGVQHEMAPMSSKSRDQAAVLMFNGSLISETGLATRCHRFSKRDFMPLYLHQFHTFYGIAQKTTHFLTQQNRRSLLPVTAI